MVFHALSGGRKEGCLLISSLKQTGLGSELAMVLPRRLLWLCPQAAHRANFGAGLYWQAHSRVLEFIA